MELPNSAHQAGGTRIHRGNPDLLSTIPDLVSQPQDPNQQTVSLLFKIGNGPPFRFLRNAFDNLALDVRPECRIAERGPPPLLARSEVFKIVLDSTLTAAEMIGHVRSHDGPAQPRPVANRGIDIGDAGYPLRDQVHRLAVQR